MYFPNSVLYTFTTYAIELGIKQMTSKPELDSRFWSSTVCGIIAEMERMIISGTEKDIPDIVVRYGLLSDAIMDVGFDCHEILYYLWNNGKIPYLWKEKHWLWFIPHQNNTMKDYQDFLDSHHFALPIEYKKIRTGGNECTCYCTSFRDALTALFALDERNLP